MTESATLESSAQPVKSLVSTTRIPGLYTLELPTPFPVGTVNAYLAEGDPLTLIDCGVGYEDGCEALSAALAELGYRLHDVRRLILTHHHADHLGLAERVVAAAGVNAIEVITHPYTVPHLEAPTQTRTAATVYTSQLFRENGVPERIVQLLAMTDDYFAKLVGTAQVSRTLDESDTLTLARQTWRVLHTPGHAGGQLCLFDEVSGVLLSSDHVLRDVSSNPLIEPPLTAGKSRPRRLMDYLQHLERVAALRPTIAYAGHGAPIDDVPALIEKRLIHHQKRADKVLALLIEKPRTLYDLSVALFPHVNELESYLTLSEALGHLDLLERDNLVSAAQRADGIWVWTAV